MTVWDDDWPEPTLHDDALDRADNLASMGYRDPLDDDPLLDEPPNQDPYWAEDMEW